jgi:hypothetical protein
MQCSWVVSMTWLQQWRLRVFLVSIPVSGTCCVLSVLHFALSEAFLLADSLHHDLTAAIIFPHTDHAFRLLDPHRFLPFFKILPNHDVTIQIMRGFLLQQGAFLLRRWAIPPGPSL